MDTLEKATQEAGKLKGQIEGAKGQVAGLLSEIEIAEAKLKAVEEVVAKEQAKAK